MVFRELTPSPGDAVSPPLICILLKLAAAFVVEGIVWGFPKAFGVLLDVYMQNPTFANQPHASSLLPLIGTFSNGIIYCSGALSSAAHGVTQHLTLSTSRSCD